jgi:ankyrin repeat protein
MVILLFSRGTDPNLPENFMDFTPLMTAVRMNNKRIAKILLDQGANPDVKNI